MAIDVHITPFHSVGGTIDLTLNAFVASTASGVITGITTMVVSFGTLYYIGMGYMIMMGQVQDPAPHFFKNMGKFLLISALALNAATYLAWVVVAINGLEDGLTSIFSAALPGGAGTVYERIDTALSSGLTAANRIIDGALKLQLYQLIEATFDALIALLVALATIAITVPAGAIIVVSKAMLSIMLGIGPLFIIMLLFGQFTSAWFDRWFGQVMTYVLQIALVTTVLTLAIIVFMSILNAVPGIGTAAQQITLWTAIELAITAIILMAVIQQANTVAGQLAGGISSAGITLRQVASAAGTASGASFMAKGVRRTNANTGQMEHRSRFSHMARGNSMASPAYAQAAKNNLTQKNGWGGVKGGGVK